MNLKLGSHVSMSGKSMLLGSAKEAESYGANTFMFYTGAPQNTKRKEISELNIDAAWNYMNEKNISDIVVHGPYIINWPWNFWQKKLTARPPAKARL